MVILVFRTVLRFKILLFTIFTIVGLYFMWDPKYLLISLLSYFLLAIVGHFIGLHRYYCHSSFECSKPMEYFIWLCGFMSGMGDPINYTKAHTRHHLYSDTPKDLLHPSTHPIMTWFGHGSLFSEYVDNDKILIPKRLKQNKFYSFVANNYIKLYYTFLGVCLLLDFKLAFYFLVVGATLSSHSAHCVNVLCHKFGYRNFDLKDCSTNFNIVNWLTLGTGLHNNHHAVPYAYTHKIREDETDFSAWLIKNLLATKVVEVKDKHLQKGNK